MKKLSLIWSLMFLQVLALSASLLCNFLRFTKIFWQLLDL